jgi:hypothetical protein
MNTEISSSEKVNYHMLKSEALLAGTLALMTAHAHCSCSKAISNKDLMTKKIISNLSQLLGHPHLTEQFRMMLGNLHNMWTTFEVTQQNGQPTESADPIAGTHSKHHHAAPAALQ